MKKLRLLLVTALALIALTGCNNTEYSIDGEFTAYETSIYNNAPQVTMVTVTIENGEIVGYYIDARQGLRTQTQGADTSDDTTDDRYSFTWKEMTKKELGEDYGMDNYGGAVAEWHIQAGRIEAYWLVNGVESATVDVDNRIDNISGVSIKDEGFSRLAHEAVELAKAGKFQTILCTADDLYSATMTVSKRGKVTELVIDVLQGSPVGATFVWRTQTKQELGFEYGMKGVGAAYTYTNDNWASTSSKSSLEWHEQVGLISDYVLENGWEDNLQDISGRGGSLDGTTLIDELAGVTVSSSNYYNLLKELYSLPAEGEIN